MLMSERLGVCLSVLHTRALDHHPTFYVTTILTPEGIFFQATLGSTSQIGGLRLVSSRSLKITLVHRAAPPLEAGRICDVWFSAR